MADAWDPTFDRGRAVFRPLAAAIEPFRGFRAWPPLDAWNARVPAGLCSAGGAPIRFVEQPPRRRRARALDVDAIYDERIFTKGEVPSRRETFHDFFNMLVWVSFPATKRAINARQRRALRARLGEAPSITRLPGARTREQDALAMLDEGGLLLATSPAARDDLGDALARGDSAIVIDAIARGEARAFLLGHAIYEHLVLGGAPVRAFVRRVPVDALDGALQTTVDVAVARALELGDPVLPSSAAGLFVDDALFR